MRTSVPRVTRPGLREFISSRAKAVFFIACNVAIGKAYYLKWLPAKSYALFHPADWFAILVFGSFCSLGISIRRSARELFVGFGFLVFCYREQPHRRLASCESDCKVVLASEV